jgi:DNA-3-methyladenine glycosylase II
MEMLPEDAALLRAARQVYGAGITMADLERLSAPYGPDQGYWAHYLRISH